VFLRRLRVDTSLIKPYVPPPIGPDEMVLDAQTFRDLEIFEGEDGQPSVYDLCNECRTEGGAKALKMRMKKPWSSSKRIHAVQQSLAFIQAHPGPFERLPLEAVTAVVEKYLDDSLPLVTSTNQYDFWSTALEVRLGDPRPYHRIVRGVSVTATMIGLLRRLVATAELREVPGEVGSVLEETRTLLARPGFGAFGDHARWSLPWWTVMRNDQTLRWKEREALERLLRLVFELDALVAMATVVTKHGFVMPEVVDGPLVIDADGVSHPFINDAVANPIQLDQERRMLFLTGPNMAGKTTYLRSCGIALYLAHLGMGVPARSFRFSPCQRMFTSISVHDNVRSGVSFFRAEALRVKAIAQALSEGYRVVALLDEPFMGTNLKDALDASRAILESFAHKQGSVFLVSSHLIELGDHMIATGHVDCQHFEAHEQEGRLRFEYLLRPGVSTQRLGMRVLREEGIFLLLEGEGNAAGTNHGSMVAS
jgi:DNA mismatch repair protein MutS